MSGNSVSMRSRFVITVLMLSLAGCAPVGEVVPTIYQSKPTPSLLPSSMPLPTHTPATVPTLTPTITPTPRIVRSINLAAWQADRDGAWFSESLDALPHAEVKASATFAIQDISIDNRRGGKISPTLVSGYVFLQFREVTPALFTQHIHTIRAFFIRSALLSFVDYENNRVLDWDRRAGNIPMKVREFIQISNEKGIPVFLEINYSDVLIGLALGLFSLPVITNSTKKENRI